MNIFVEIQTRFMSLLGRTVGFAVMWVGRLIYDVISTQMKPRASAAVLASERRLGQLELAAVVMAGLAHAYWAAWDWTMVSSGLFGLFGLFLEGQMVNALTWVLAVVGSAVLVIACGGRHYLLVARECLPTGAAVGTLAACLIALMLLVSREPAMDSDLSVALGLLTAVASFALLFAAGVAMVQGVRYRFRAAESARALLPVSVLLVGAWALGGSVAQTYARGLSPNLPWAVSVFLAFLSPLVAVGWSSWELLALHRADGVFTPRSLTTVGA